MKIEARCPACSDSYLIDEANVPPGGGDLPCLTCGGTIRVRGPAAAAPVAAAPATPPARTERSVRPAGGRENAEEVVCPRCSLHFVPRRVHAEAAASAERRPTVLVVEDMEYFLEIARDALGERFEVVTAKTLAETREILASRTVDLMVIDLTLDGGDDGQQLLRELRPKRFPVLVFTAQDESEMYGETWEALRALGADDLVLKGMNVGEVLLRKVAAMLGVEIDDTRDE